MTGIDVITHAFIESNIFGPADPIPAEDADFALNKLNRLLDNWNADRRAVYTDVLAGFTLIPTLSPHTIGPGGVWIVAQRPVTIASATLWLSATVKQPIDTEHDTAWYQALDLPLQQAAQPTDLYYEPDWPEGALFFWPVPTSALRVDLQIRTVLTGLTLAGTFSFPPGYEDAITLTLGEALADAYPGSTAPAGLAKAAEKARARIFGVNDATPKLATRDSGMPGGGGGLGYNWQTGMNNR